jgi:WD40 repeat protein
VRLAETSQPIGSISFSPDGKYLAATFPADSVPSLILYDTTTGKIVRTLMGRWHKVQWAPTGQSVLLFSEQTVSKLAKPLDPQSQPEKMRNENCQNVVWNPKP